MMPKGKCVAGGITGNVYLSQNKSHLLTQR